MAVDRHIWWYFPEPAVRAKLNVLKILRPRGLVGSTPTRPTVKSKALTYLKPLQGAFYCQANSEEYRLIAVLTGTDAPVSTKVII
jgi:hypothetical protein